MPIAAEAKAAAQLLLQGGLVSFPTDTVYGLACLATDPEARRRFYQAKGRPQDQPSILMAADIATLTPWLEFTQPASAAAAEFWPGPLTLVLRATAKAEQHLGEIVRNHTVAARIPAHETALALLRAVGAPLCTSSANRAGDPPPTTAAQARDALGDAVDAVLDGTPGSGRPSSILDLSGPEPKVLRQGAIPAERLLR